MRCALRLTLIVSVVLSVAGCVAADCAESDDCVDGVCVAGACVECESDDDCTGDESCEDNECQAPGEGEGEGDAGEGEGEGEGDAGEGEGEGEGDGGACVVDADCATNQFCQGGSVVCTCDNGQCIPQQAPCDDNADCTTPPLTACDLGTGQCTFGDCQNGGVTCDAAANETCAGNGECVVGSATECAVDDDCPADEFCSVPFGGGPGACATGCRNNDNCEAPFVCNGVHQCADPATTAGFGEACVEDADCQAGLFCTPFLNTCGEDCSGAPTGDCAVDGCCEVSQQPCCFSFGGFGVCGTNGCPSP